MILTITAPSGAGKTTLYGRLIAEVPNFALISSYTTRKPRITDLPGEYVYCSDQVFEEMKNKVPFLWHREFDGFKYMTTADSVLMTKGYPDHVYGMILSPDVIGQLKNYAEKTNITVLSVYIISPPAKILEERMAARGESPEKIKSRIELCRDWDLDAGTGGQYEYFITNNGTIEEAVHKLKVIIEENRL